MKCGSLDMVEGVCKKQKDMEILKNSCSSSSCGNRISRTQNLNWDDKLNFFLTLHGVSVLIYKLEL